jgi:hypothetical protein
VYYFSPEWSLIWSERFSRLDFFSLKSMHLSGTCLESESLLSSVGLPSSISDSLAIGIAKWQIPLSEVSIPLLYHISGNDIFPGYIDVKMHNFSGFHRIAILPSWRLQYIGDSSVAIVIRLRTGRQRIKDSIPFRCKKCVYRISRVPFSGLK